MPATAPHFSRSVLSDLSRSGIDPLSEFPDLPEHGTMHEDGYRLRLVRTAVELSEIGEAMDNAAVLSARGAARGEQHLWVVHALDADGGPPSPVAVFDIYTHSGQVHMSLGPGNRPVPAAISRWAEKKLASVYGFTRIRMV